MTRPLSPHFPKPPPSLLPLCPPLPPQPRHRAWIEEIFGPREFRSFPRARAGPSWPGRSWLICPSLQVRIRIRNDCRGQAHVGERGALLGVVGFIPELNWYNCSLLPAKHGSSGLTPPPADRELFPKLLASHPTWQAQQLLLGALTTPPHGRATQGPLRPEPATELRVCPGWVGEATLQSWCQLLGPRSQRTLGVQRGVSSSCCCPFPSCSLLHPSLSPGGQLLCGVLGPPGQLPY